MQGRRSEGVSIKRFEAIMPYLSFPFCCKGFLVDNGASIVIYYIVL